MAVRYWSFSLVIAAAVLGNANAGAITLTQDGEAKAVLVVPANAEPIARYAAEELMRHLELISGAVLDISEEPDAPGSPSNRVYIGETEAAAQAGIDVNALAPEGYTVRLADGALYIAAKDGPGDPLSTGHSHSGALWGVYDLLNDELGVRWLWPGDLGTYVPSSATVTLTPESGEFHPQFRWRRVGPGIESFSANDPAIGFSDDALDAYRQAQSVFLRRHRMGDSRKPSAGHAVSGWWDQYGEDHPDWFQQLPDGTRGPISPESSWWRAHVSKCVTSGGVQEKILSDWKERVEADPDSPPALLLGEADTRARCECPQCLAWDPPQPSMEEIDAMTPSIRRLYRAGNVDHVGDVNHFPGNVSDRYARFWKLMHERAMEIHPEVETTAYVYFNYFIAPHEPMELYPGMHLEFVPWDHFWFPRPVEEQRFLKQQWKDWVATGASISYRPNYFHDGYVMPHVFARQFGDMFQFVLRNSATGFSLDSLRGQWAVQGPTLYLMNRLHQRPDASIEEVLTEYYTAFGPAATAVKAYFDFWEAHTAKKGLQIYEIAEAHDTDRQHLPLHSYARMAGALFPPSAFEEAQAILDQAKEKAHGAYAERVAFLQTGLTHARKSAELATSFHDSDAEPRARREVYEALIAFRRQHEMSFFSNLTMASHQETESWGDRAGFIAED